MESHETLFRIVTCDFIEIAEDILGRGERFRFRANGSSMFPFIKDGDSVTITTCGESVSTGDVVLLKTATGRLLLHRIVRKLEFGVVTMGDALLSDDGVTLYRDILGKAERVSGNGYNFHLTPPFSYFVGKIIAFVKGLYRFPFMVKIIKKVLVRF